MDFNPLRRLRSVATHAYPTWLPKCLFISVFTIQRYMHDCEVVSGFVRADNHWTYLCVQLKGYLWNDPQIIVTKYWTISRLEWGLLCSHFRGDLPPLKEITWQKNGF